MFRCLSILVLFFSCCTIHPVFASIDQCQPVPVGGESLTLHVEKTAFFLIYNRASTDVWLSHSMADSDLTTRIAPKKWVGLILTPSDFVGQCIESKPGHEQQMPCEEMIRICQAEKVKIPVAYQKSHYIKGNPRAKLAFWRRPLLK